MGSDAFTVVHYGDIKHRTVFRGDGTEDWFTEWLQRVQSATVAPRDYWNCVTIPVVPATSVIVARVSGPTAPFGSSYNSLCLTAAAVHHQIFAPTLFREAAKPMVPNEPVPDQSLEPEEEEFIQPVSRELRATSTSAADMPDDASHQADAEVQNWASEAAAAEALSVQRRTGGPVSTVMHYVQTQPMPADRFTKASLNVSAGPEPTRGAEIASGSNDAPIRSYVPETEVETVILAERLEPSYFDETTMTCIDVLEMCRSHTDSNPAIDQPTVSYHKSTITIGDDLSEGRIGASAAPLFGSYAEFGLPIADYIPMVPPGGNSLWCEICEMWVKVVQHTVHLKGRIHKARVRRSIQHTALDGPYQQRYCDACDLWFHSHRLKKHVRNAEHAELVSFRTWQLQFGAGTLAAFRSYLERNLHDAP